MKKQTETIIQVEKVSMKFPTLTDEVEKSECKSTKASSSNRNVFDVFPLTEGKNHNTSTKTSKKVENKEPVDTRSSASAVTDSGGSTFWSSSYEEILRNKNDCASKPSSETIQEKNKEKCVRPHGRHGDGSATKPQTSSHRDWIKNKKEKYSEVRVSVRLKEADEYLYNKKKKNSPTSFLNVSGSQKQIKKKRKRKAKTWPWGFEKKKRKPKPKIDITDVKTSVGSHEKHGDGSVTKQQDWFQTSVHKDYFIKKTKEKHSCLKELTVSLRLNEADEYLYNKKKKNSPTSFLNVSGSQKQIKKKRKRKAKTWPWGCEKKKRKQKPFELSTVNGISRNDMFLPVKAPSLSHIKKKKRAKFLQRKKTSTLLQKGRLPTEKEKEQRLEDKFDYLNKVTIPSKSESSQAVHEKPKVFSSPYEVATVSSKDTNATTLLLSKKQRVSTLLQEKQKSEVPVKKHKSAFIAPETHKITSTESEKHNSVLESCEQSRANAIVTESNTDSKSSYLETLRSTGRTKEYVKSPKRFKFADKSKESKKSCDKFKDILQIVGPQISQGRRGGMRISDIEEEKKKQKSGTQRKKPLPTNLESVSKQPKVGRKRKFKRCLNKNIEPKIYAAANHSSEEAVIERAANTDGPPTVGLEENAPSFVPGSNSLETDFFGMPSSTVTPQPELVPSSSNSSLESDTIGVGSSLHLKSPFLQMEITRHKRKEREKIEPHLGHREYKDSKDPVFIAEVDFLIESYPKLAVSVPKICLTLRPGAFPLPSIFKPLKINVKKKTYDKLFDNENAKPLKPKHELDFFKGINKVKLRRRISMPREHCLDLMEYQGQQQSTLPQKKRS